MKMALGQKDGGGPLAGIKVLDLSAVVSGPLCTQVLGDLGAEVVKVEPLVGDTTRRMGPPFKAGLTGYVAQFNRNKRSLSIDLKTEAGRAVVQRLARDADVLIQNFRPDVAERIGIPVLGNTLNQTLAARELSLDVGRDDEGPAAGQPARGP